MTAVLSTSCLVPGDHVKWPRSGGYDHHAIVDAVPGDGKIRVIEYGGDTGKKRDLEVRKHSLDGAALAGMYKCPYDECDNNDIVLERARKRVGEKKYSVIMNNCEHFASSCKTGRKRCSQLRQHGVRVAQAFTTGLAATVAGRRAALQLKGTCEKIGWREIIEKGGKQAGRNGLKCRWKVRVVGIESVVIGGCFFAYECYQAKKKYQAAKQNAANEKKLAEYQHAINKEVAEAGFGELGSTVGATALSVALGSWLPVVGTAIGASLGSLAGNFLGKMFARWLF